MGDSAVAQREARRLRILKNAETRMNRLCNKIEADPSNDAPLFDIKSDDSKLQGESILNSNNEDYPTEPQSQPSYNLRRRGHPEPSTPGEKTQVVDDKDKKPCKPSYEIVDDPEVPSLAEFLATKEASKPSHPMNNTPNNFMTLPPKTMKSSRNIRLNEKRVEYIKVVGIILTALTSRWFLSLQLGQGLFLFESLFQSMFFPFLLSEILLSFAISTCFPDVSPPVQGSLLTTALMLCGIKPELIQIYIIIMSRITNLSNDLFLYIFAFLVCHAVI